MHKQAVASAARLRDGREVRLTPLRPDDRDDPTRAPGVAEVAVVVATGRRRVGLATLLARRLSDTALRNGFPWLTATHLPGNHAVARMPRAAGAVVADGEAVVRCRPWTGHDAATR